MKSLSISILCLSATLLSLATANGTEVFPSSSPDVQICRQVPDLQELWQNTYIPKLKIHGPGVGPIDCNNPSDKNLKVAAALYLVDLAGRGLKTTYLDYISQKTVGGIIYEGSDNGVEMANSDANKTIRLTEHFFSEDKDVYIRAATFPHESRHLDNPQNGILSFPHTRCDYSNNKYDQEKNDRINSNFSQKFRDQINNKIESRQKKNSSEWGSCDFSFDNTKDGSTAYSAEVVFLRRLYEKQDADVQLDKKNIMFWIQLTLWTHFNNMPKGAYDWYSNPDIHIPNQAAVSSQTSH